MGHKVSIHQYMVRGSEGRVCVEEHVRRSLGNGAGHFVAIGFVFIVFIFAGAVCALLRAVIMLLNGAFDLRFFFLLVFSWILRDCDKGHCGAVALPGRTCGFSFGHPF
jgi:hypothetical protein